jgi:tetratricopeptide (TPR) repeat protein
MKKTTTAVIFLFALTALAAFGQTTADEWYTKAGEYFASGDYANAITAYSETIRRDSSNLDAYWLRGLAYFRIKNYDAAIADYNTVIKDAPDFPVAYIVRGDAYGAKGVYHTAVADYKTGLEKGYDLGGFTVDKSSKADMWFCGAMFMEITVNRFLGKPDVVAKYENWLKTVCDKNKLTRVEVEVFYRQNIGTLIAATVDAEFNTKHGNFVPAEVYGELKKAGEPDALALVKNAVTNFFINPNRDTYAALTGIHARYWLNGGLNRQSFGYSGRESFYRVLEALSPAIAEHVSDDVSQNATALARIPNDRQYNIFSNPRR